MAKPSDGRGFDASIDAKPLPGESETQFKAVNNGPRGVITQEFAINGAEHVVVEDALASAKSKLAKRASLAGSDSVLGKTRARTRLQQSR